MSTQLPIIDLSAASVGSKYKVSFPTFIKFNPQGPIPYDPAYIRLYNESGCGLALQFGASGRSEYIPAGGWPTYHIEPNDSEIAITVTSVLSVAAPITQLIPVYYAPGENVPMVPTLGNSPIGGAVSTSAIQTVSNESSSTGTLIIDIGPTGHTQIIAIYNDHFTWNVLQGGVVHQVLAGQTSASPLVIGASGDTTEVAGNLLCDNTLTVDGTTYLANGNVNVDTSGNVIVGGNLTVDGSTNVAGGLSSILKFLTAAISIIQDHNGHAIFDWHNDTDLDIVCPGSTNFVNIKVGSAVNNRVAHFDSSGNLVIKGTLTQNGTP